MTDAAPQVTDNRAAHRYEVQTPAGPALIAYHRRDGVIDLLHTEVPPAAEGKGIAGALARYALEDARASGLRVIPSCPYVAAYIRRHPEYADLVYTTD
jgi:predicted GNAT family acetyltransferase